MTSTTASEQPDHKSSIKETLISIIIAFVLAFVFRGFVVEAFLIPTGSMAPTLLGQHMRFNGPTTGYDWAAGPREFLNGNAQTPRNPQGDAGRPLKVRDPMTGPLPNAFIGEGKNRPMDRAGVPVRGGDRIFVLKYLGGVYEPARWEVVVFKNPLDPAQNYIKRLLGLPGEMVALVDGDVFFRPWTDADKAAPNPWGLDGWKIARKPDDVQKVMWQTIFDSAYTPLSPPGAASTFNPPWLPNDTVVRSADWDLSLKPGEAPGTYRYSGAGPTKLGWDWRNWPIVDTYAYNDISTPSPDMAGTYPVSDLKVSMGFRPAAAGAKASVTLLARRHEFRAEVQDGSVQIRMRPAGGEWALLTEKQGDWKLAPGLVTNIEFIHADQAVELRINGRIVARAEYDWNIDQRLLASMGLTSAAVVDGGDLRRLTSVNWEEYPLPRIVLDFSGGAFTLHNVALARDVHYQAAMYPDKDLDGSIHVRRGLAALGTYPLSTPFLTGSQYFCCGDNSPQSSDCRLMGDPHPWAKTIEPEIGVVHRDLMIGRAFFVYFPALQKKGVAPIPDFGRMRFIR